MYRNVNLDAHLSALLFLGSAALFILLLLATVMSFFRRRPWVRHSLSALAVLVLGYGALLVAFSAFSREYTLLRGEEKYFCELDCHLAYSVQKVERMKTIGNVAAIGEFYVVTLRTRFDPNTIAPWRGDAPLQPGPREVLFSDSHNQTFSTSSAGQRAWDAAHGGSTSLMAPLRPGEAYETKLVFDVPADVRSPRLLVAFRVFPTQVLIGDENSLLHRKTYFSLQAAASDFTRLHSTRTPTLGAARRESKLACSWPRCLSATA